MATDSRSKQRRRGRRRIIGKQFPRGPKQLWSHAAGNGSSGAAITENKVIIFHRVRNEELVECCDVETGKPLWSSRFPTRFRPQVGSTDGPLAVPLIQKNTVFVYGTSGILAALNFTTGDVLWQKNLINEYRAQEGYFGPGSSPILVDDLLIINAGVSEPKQGWWRLDQATGKEVWKSTSEHASYSSPIVYEAGGRKFILITTRMNTYLLDAKTGAEIDKVPFGQRGPTVNAANPVLTGDHFLLTASYGIGSVWELSQPTVFKSNGRTKIYLRANTRRVFLIKIIYSGLMDVRIWGNQFCAVSILKLRAYLGANRAWLCDPDSRGR
ncbi:MAG: PQQ-binding-like beta-propeller repeat protein [Planctomycetaceae bacterium]